MRVEPASIAVQQAPPARPERVPDAVEQQPSAWRSLMRPWEARVGFGLGLLMIAVIVFGPLVAPYTATAVDAGPPLASPSWSNPFGTDVLGRDVFSRFLSGGRSILVIPALAVTLAFLVGGALGMIAAYRAGWRDVLIARVFDVLVSLPPLLVVLVMIAGLGTSSVVLIGTVALVFLPRIGRIVRGATETVVDCDYVVAAQARGEGTGWILAREVLPNIAAPVLAEYALRMTYAIIFVSSLSFLGLGAQPPAPDWGVMVAESRGLLSVSPVAALAPAAGIVAVSLAFNLIAEGITRYLSRESADGSDPLQTRERANR